MTRELELEAALRNLIEVVEWADKNKDTIAKDSIVMEAAREALALPKDTPRTPMRRTKIILVPVDEPLPIDETPPMPHCNDPDHGTDGSACPTCFSTGGW